MVLKLVTLHLRQAELHRAGLEELEVGLHHVLGRAIAHVGAGAQQRFAKVLDARFCLYAKGALGQPAHSSVIARAWWLAT
jgi:hypothetical protein